MKKILLTIIGVIILLIFSSLAYIKLMLPNVGDAPELNVPKAPKNVANGKYLANSVAVCMDCHSVRDWNKLSGPLTPGTLGRGGELFNQDMGLPGVYYSRNLTPYGLKDWTDGEIFRAITTGVNKEGKALFPIMPHPNYGRSDKNDIYDIIAYLRTLNPIEFDPPTSTSDFPMNFIINTIPKEAAFTTRPDKTNKVAYGKYLTTLASCGDCHTPFEKGEYDMSHFLAGGRSFPFPWAVITTPNLTPDKETGLGNWTEDVFLQRFKQYQDSSFVLPTVKPGDFVTMMPWTMYSTMEEDDLKAIFAYLQSLDPIENKIERFRLK